MATVAKLVSHWSFAYWLIHLDLTFVPEYDGKYWEVNMDVFICPYWKFERLKVKYGCKYGIRIPLQALYWTLDIFIDGVNLWPFKCCRMACRLFVINLKVLRPFQWFTVQANDLCLLLLLQMGKWHREWRHRPLRRWPLLSSRGWRCICGRRANHPALSKPSPSLSALTFSPLTSIVSC